MLESKIGHVVDLLVNDDPDVIGFVVLQYFGHRNRPGHCKRSQIWTIEMKKLGLEGSIKADSKKICDMKRRQCVLVLPACSNNTDV
jgi:hypothetical protein